MFEDFEEQLEKIIKNIKEPIVKVTLPEWPNSFHSFPYRYYLNVPLEERFNGEWLLFRSNHEIFEENDQYTDGLYSVKFETFIKYRINSLRDEQLKNQYWTDYSNFLKEKLKQVAASNKKDHIAKSPFSVLEWATIFYYADETKLLPDSFKKIERMAKFMSKHQVETSFSNFKTKYYDASRRINKKNDYPIKKLEKILPFLKETYKETITKVKNDIIYLEDNKTDY